MRIHYLGALLIAGCGDPVPDHTEYHDVARIVGATIATAHGGATMGAVNDSVLLAFGGMPWGFTSEGGTISGDHGALAHRYIMVICRDLHNQVLKPCTQMTNTATMVASWSGSIAGPGLELQSSRQGMWTLANLQTWMPTIIGSSNLQTEGTVGGRRYELVAAESETMVTPTAMMGGSMHLDVEVTEPIQLEIAADVVFDNLVRSASLLLDGEYAYRVDLATGAIEE
jgi:hypothetical protein